MTATIASLHTLRLILYRKVPIVFRGIIRTLAYVNGMANYLQRIGCLLKDFGEHVEAKTAQLE